MKKRIISIHFVALLLCAMMLVAVVPAFAATGDLHIKNKTDWNNFANAVTSGNSYDGKTVYLDADISIGKPVGIYDNSYKHPFCGTFEGNGHTLTLDITYDTNGNPGVNLGVFGYTNGATIRNLNVKGNVTGIGGTGSMVGYAVNTSFSNCTSNANVQSERNKYTGGIAGYADGGSFSNCTNSGSVSGTEAVGGIAGYAGGGSSFVNCVNNGAISGKKYLGGIVGDTPLDESASVLVANCINCGSITASADGGIAGGIAGRMSYCGTLKNCFTCGEVSNVGASGIVVGWASRSFSCENCFYLLLDVSSGMEAINHDNGKDYPATGIESVYNADAINTLNKCAIDNGWAGWLPEKETLTFTSYEKYPTYNQCTESIIWSLDDSGLLTILGSGEIDDYKDYTNVPWSDKQLAKNPIKVRSAVIRDGVTGIGEHAFEYCNSLTAVTIPGSVTSIGDYAFYSCENLTAVTIPGSVTSIGNYAFTYCESLSSAVLSDGVTNIGDYAFFSCENLTAVTIPDSVMSIGKHAFNGCESLSSITIPDSVTSIGDYAFYMCKKLTAVTIPGSVTSIGSYAFDCCTSLSSAVLSDGVTNIGDYAFFSCENLTAVTIPGSVTSIGVRAFAYCKSLSSITIPDSVTYIGRSAFEACINLKLVRLGSGITKIDSCTFSINNAAGIVYYNGTRAQWKQVEISERNYFLDRSVIVCTDDRTVTYDANGGVGAPDAQTKLSGTALTLSETIPTREGYTFLGWAAAPDAAEAQYQPGDSYNEDADITLYAVWAVIGTGFVLSEGNLCIIIAVAVIAVAGVVTLVITKKKKTVK